MEEEVAVAEEEAVEEELEEAAAALEDAEVAGPDKVPGSGGWGEAREAASEDMLLLQLLVLLIMFCEDFARPEK